ncbi:DUF3237 domain-containing protein [Tersicoccus sp. Bi-70]|uniref:DUF3237 domain-containing protein n=1 Tax=Tersicoccus sp. Bi-70 TaxID=1897634 RepID=UPI00097813DB|nr:DUF3237 domain-containing protein [Tersicoccus sp. Bi-70]OMH32354.1 hypothetical protein BGP79_08005 [Tersicoccus sp. Bi-70]
MRTPTLTPFCTLSVRVAAPATIGQTTDGARRIVPITGGTVTGTDPDGRPFTGTVLPAGADVQRGISATVSELDARYGIALDDGEHLFVHNAAIRSGSAEDLAAIARSEPVDPARLYFRSWPRLHGTGERWAWLVGRLFVGTGERRPDAVDLAFFLLD